MALDKKISILSIYDILPNRFQPRIKFGEDKINELAESIRKYGVIQPIIVRNIGDKYEIIAGERRYKASILAGLKEIPAIINNLDDKDSSEIALIENVQRENLTPIEEAISIKKILDMGSKTQEQLAEKLGISQSALANKLRLLQLDETVQEALLEKKISERHARSLLKIHNSEEQQTMLNRIIKERMTVRKLDEEIQKMVQHQPETKKEIFTFLPKIENDKEDKDVKQKDLFEENELKILDMLNDYYKDNKEEKNMNSNDPMNQFTTPGSIDENNSTPIAYADRKIMNENPQFTMSQETINNSMSLGQTNLNEKETTSNSSTLLENNKVEEREMNPSPIKKPEGKFFDVLPSRENMIENHQEETIVPSSENSLDKTLLTGIGVSSTPISTPSINSEVVKPEMNTISADNSPKFEDISYLKENLIHRNESVENSTITASSAIIPEKEIPSFKDETKKEPIFTSKQENIISNISKEVETNKAILSYNMREAINEIRDITSKIESTGLAVDTEEMDLPNYYEVIIHLMKEE